MLVIYRNEEHLCYVPGCETRDYRKKDVLWDLEQFKACWLHNEEDL